MNKYLYKCLVVLLLTGMISCNKEEITIEEPGITLEPPQELGYPVAVGQVKDTNGVLIDAEVAVYQLGELKGTTFSNIDGEFNTIDIETEPGEDLILEFSKEEYKSTYRKRSEEILKTSRLDVELTESNGQPSSPTLIDGITEYVSFSGYIKDLQGQANTAKIAAVLEATAIEDGVEYNVNISYQETTDSHGYYELILPKNAFNLKVAIYSDLYCIETFTEEEVVISPAPIGVLAERMGPYTEDVQLQNYYNPRMSTPLIDIRGQVKECDSSAVIWPSAELHMIDSEGFTTITDMEIDNDGNFAYNSEACLDLPYTVKIVGSEFSSNTHSDTVVALVSDGIYSNLNLLLLNCNTTVVNHSTAVMNVGGVTYSFDQINPRIENGNLISDALTGSYGLFTIPNIQIGENEIHNLELGDWGDSITFKATNSIMTANISALTSSAATITVAGDFVDVNGAIVSGTCTLNLFF